MLIIMACSAAKLAGAQVPTVKYDTRQHRLLHQEMFIEGMICSHDTMILSAEFGLIPITRPVADYDRKMDAARAKEFSSDDRQLAIIKDAIAEENHETVALYGGALYRNTVKALLDRAGFDGEIIEIIGENRGCGDHFAALQDLMSQYSVDA
jgi:hypothetical protein